MKDSQGLADIEWPVGMSDSEKDALRDVLRAYDGAIGEFENDHSVIFPSEAERLRLFFASQKKWSRQWATPGLCMHAGCSAASISRSHSIPMSASIKAIAENGHVVTPRFSDGKVDVVPIGIRDASTFPGFCQTHEAQFSDFESKKQITTPEHFYLQAFRTVCREIYTQRHHKQKLEAGLVNYKKLREAFVIARMGQVQRSDPINVSTVTFENDTLEDSVVKQISSLSENLTELDGLYHGILDELKKETGKISMVATVFDMQLPACLSGIGILPYREGVVSRRALCFLAIVPEAAETKIIMGALGGHEKALTAYLQNDSSMAFLRRLESWMCHGSDHWFMTPSTWEAISPARKDAICARILDPSPSIADPTEFSVLDGPRRRILAFAEAQLRDGNIAPSNVSDVKKLIAEESAKLNWMP